MDKKPLIRKELAVGIILLFVGMSIIPSTAQDTKNPILTSSGKWWYVGGSGPENYTEIQDAIDNVSDGDTVFVYNGTYRENIVINKANVSLLGQDNRTTVIIANNTADAILISGDRVKIAGFRILNNESFHWNTYWGIKTVSNSNIITGNIIEGDQGIQLYTLDNNSIVKNTIRNCWTGIYVAKTSTNNNISHNSFSNCTEWGIFLIRTDTCMIFNNTFSNNYGGLWIDQSTHVNVSSNYFFNNGCGVWGYGSDHFYLYNNIFSYNRDVGLKLEISSRATIHRNSFEMNKYGIYVRRFGGGFIEQNNFLSNTHSATISECIDDIFWARLYYLLYGDPPQLYRTQTTWKENYWGKNFTGPHIIFGWMFLFYDTYDNQLFGRIPWIDIDWRPAKEPYDVPGMK